MISVFPESERVFGNNGIKTLHPLYAMINKEDNGDYFLELEDLVENYAYYQSGLILYTDTPWGKQAFRCANPARTSSRVKVKALHITYDAQRLTISDSYAVEANCNDALVRFNSATDEVSPLSVLSDVTTIANVRIVRKSLMQAIETCLETYGGHLVRDNFNLRIMTEIGEDRGVTLALGKNIIDIEIEENWDNVCTKILPYTSDGQTSVTLDGDQYYSLDEELYDIPYTRPIEFKNELVAEDFETNEEYETAIKEQLLAQAVQYLENHKFPEVNYSVSASIQNVSDIGDKIFVKHPRCKVDILTTVIALQYDCIRQRYEKITFGNFKKEIKGLANKIDEVKETLRQEVTVTKSFLTLELEKATAKINDVYNSSYILNDGSKILVVDTLPPELARNVMKISSGGIGFSQTGINGTFNSAWTIDGTLDMQQINVMNLTASMIKGGTLILGGKGNSSGTIELYDTSNRKFAEMNKDGITVFATNGSFVKFNADIGVAGFNSQGTKIWWADGETFHMKNAEIENILTLGGHIQVVPVQTETNVGIGFVALTLQESTLSTLGSEGVPLPL